ncbi:Hypothetical protein ERS075558_04728 [Mycobacteroides abscessus]|nr:hypothetical protein [Mycobacteroides abscessus]SHP49144.1 Uncharacterised protein [Mycobacteroides abscessus subsp. abscessus]MBE5455944.1 hypothetical protein [Mycobacteroides abscessus]MBE5460210.1 hypothetical protein [Mycobacteroides abscessus]QOF28741.1 hypothetical protein E3G43_002294 [Mycobacteroides abscessus]
MCGMARNVPIAVLISSQPAGSLPRRTVTGMHHYACVSAVLVAAFALAAPARGEPACQFSGGLGPDAACTQSVDEDDFYSPWMWPGDDGFGVGYGYGWR